MGARTSRREAFIKLGEFLRDFCESFKGHGPLPDRFADFAEKIRLARHQNGWFTESQVLFALENWGRTLTAQQLDEWLSAYDLSRNKRKQVALIMAGNIPLVGFHDFLSVLLTGNAALVKLSSSDKVLLPYLADLLIEYDDGLGNDIRFVEDRLTDFDAVIATGSNNTARYFEYYFGGHPHIIRKNRNSTAVLTGKETSGQLKALGEDIFRYFGMGCRNVSKLWVPEAYDFTDFFEAMYAYRNTIDHAKYANNYDYNKAVYLMSDFKILDNGFLLLREETSYASPIATLFHESYSSVETLKKVLRNDAGRLQCVVGSGMLDGEVPFGQTQRPGLSTYADHVDTVDFLLRT